MRDSWKLVKRARRLRCTPHALVLDALALHGTMPKAARALRVNVNTIRYWKRKGDQSS